MAIDENGNGSGRMRMRLGLSQTKARLKARAAALKSLRSVYEYGQTAAHFWAAGEKGKVLLALRS